MAGCVAQSVWNLLDGRAAEAGIRDLDIAYHDPTDLSAEAETAQECRLRGLFRESPLKLDVKNQARVHLWYGRRFGREIRQFRSSAEAIASYHATAISIGVACPAGRFALCAPYGLADLFAMVVRPNKRLAGRGVYEAKAARWLRIWPSLTIVPWDGDQRDTSHPLE